MTNVLNSYETMSPIEGSVMERPHYTQPEDLMELAEGGFIDYNAIDANDDRIETFFVSEFVAAARELGYDDLEYGEAIDILETTRRRTSIEYRDTSNEAINRYFDAAWLKNIPYGESVEDFIRAYKKGELEEQLAEEFEHSGVASGTIGGPLIGRIYHELLANDLSRRIQQIITDYEQEQAKLIITEDEEQGEYND